MPAITGSANNVTINGGSHTIDGGNVQRGFFVYQGTVAINDLTIQHAPPPAATAGPGVAAAAAAVAAPVSAARSSSPAAASWRWAGQ